MHQRSIWGILLATAIVLGTSLAAHAITDTEEISRMPGSQPGQVTIHGQAVAGCGCHEYAQTDVPRHDQIFTWQGSMMGQSLRDPIFWACLAVAAQDSVWAVNNYLIDNGLPTNTFDIQAKAEAADICLRCHTPQGWLNGNSSNTTGSALLTEDFDGVHCEFCHRLVDPLYHTASLAPIESTDFIGYWDEANGPIESTATQTEDNLVLDSIRYFDNTPFYLYDHTPISPNYNENGAGQYYVDVVPLKGTAPNQELATVRGPFKDALMLATDRHSYLYSRYTKSRYFCATCHDVSNPAVANLGLSGLADDGSGHLISEQYSANRFGHVERTFSEFSVSAYGTEAGAAVNASINRELGVTRANKCQDCHMPPITARGCSEVTAKIRPTESSEHPNSGMPVHDFSGGNLWITQILASIRPTNPQYDQVNAALLQPGDVNFPPGFTPTPPAATSYATLTMNPNNGFFGLDNDPNWEALAAGAQRARDQLLMAANVIGVVYNPNGLISFRVVNNTGHKLISGFLEGRRLFANVKVYDGDTLIYEVNPYDSAVGTIKGLPGAPLGASEIYRDDLVYECKAGSSLTGELETFHFALATTRTKDNRIPPKGFDPTQAAARLAEPVVNGISAPAYFTAAEYAGGYDQVTLNLPGAAGGTSAEVTLYYQGTSKEYVEFLFNEINAEPGQTTLPDPGGDPLTPAYLINGADADALFTGLSSWGNTIYDLWRHNHGLDGLGASVDGVVPFAMASAVSGSGAVPAVISLLLS